MTNAALAKLLAERAASLTERAEATHDVAAHKAALQCSYAANALRALDTLDTHATDEALTRVLGESADVPRATLAMREIRSARGRCARCGGTATGHAAFTPAHLLCGTCALKNGLDYIPFA